MIKAIVICGGMAVREYNEIGKVPDGDNVDDVVDVVELNTKAEYDAYCKGLSDANGWEETLVLAPIYATTPDCKHCESWRNFFADREKDTFCPDCGKLLNEPIYEVIEFEGEEFNVRVLDIYEELGVSRVSTESLQGKMIDEEGSCLSDEAEQLDNTIIFYVPDDKISLPDNLLIEYIKQHMK